MSYQRSPSHPIPAQRVCECPLNVQYIDSHRIYYKRRRAYNGSVNVRVFEVEIVRLDKSQFANDLIEQRLATTLHLRHTTSHQLEPYQQSYDVQHHDPVSSSSTRTQQGATHE